jgi:type VII secretion integral membrane protein EccD
VAAVIQEVARVASGFSRVTVVDAVATATRYRSGRWTAATTRVFGLLLGVVALLGGAVAVLFAGPPHDGGALAGLGVAAGLLVAAVVLARVGADRVGGAVVALVAAVYAAVGGLLLLADDRGIGQLRGPQVLTSVVAAVVTVALAAAVVPGAAPIFLCAGAVLVASLLATTIVIAFDTSAAGAAAITATVAFALLPTLPAAAYRLARSPAAVSVSPTPVSPAAAAPAAAPPAPVSPAAAAPADGGSLRPDTDGVDAVPVLARSERADAFLAGMLGALAIVGCGAAVTGSFDGGRGLAMCTVLGLLLMARARWFAGRRHRLPLLAAGTVALLAAGVAVFDRLDHTGRLTVVLGAALGVAAISVGFGLAAPRRPVAPVWGRVLDIVEVLLILAVVPLALWQSGLLAWIRTLDG